jgi:hypothetical protein
MENLNAYDENTFRSVFSQTELYDVLEKDFDVLDFTKIFSYWNREGTPRYLFARRLFSVVPFYYIDFLQKTNPTVIYDLGCGWNIFKKYIPQVIGVGAENPESPGFFADLHDYVDDDYINGHQNYFEAVFSINALHFIPLTEMAKRVTGFYSMLKPNGVGWLALNAERMIEHDDTGFFAKQSTEWLDDYIRKQLSCLEIDYEVFDVDLSERDEQLNGNIRLVMKKS